MAQYNYTFQNYNPELMTRAVARDINVSTKHAVEICNFLRYKNLQKAKQALKEVIDKKRAVPFKKYNGDVGHKRGAIAAGRYPVKASKEVLKLLESVEINSQNKGFSTGELKIVHFCAHMASRPAKYGRQRGRQFKRSHVEVVVSESLPEKKKEKEIKPEKKETLKTMKAEEEVKEIKQQEARKSAETKKPSGEEAKKPEETKKPTKAEIKKPEETKKEETKQEKTTKPSETQIKKSKEPSEEEKGKND